MTNLEKIKVILAEAMRAQELDDTLENQLFFLQQLRKDTMELVEPSHDRQRWLSELDYEIVRLKLNLSIEL